MLPFSLDYNHLSIESFILRTIHSSLLRIAWGRSATSDCETSGVETGGVETGGIKTGDKEIRESKMSLLEV